MPPALLFPARMSLSNLASSVVEGSAPGSLKFRALLFLSGCRREPAVLVTAVTFFFVSLDYALAPTLRNTTPLVVLVFLLCLLVRRLSFDAVEASSSSLLVLWRFTLFVLLHLGIVGVTRVLVGSSAETSNYTSSIATLTAACKFLVFLPSAVLWPRSEWQRFDRIYRSEWLAAAIALVTLVPNRIFVFAWPAYSQVLGHFVHALSVFLVPGLGYHAGAAPTLTGPTLDVEIVFGCSGLDGIRLFQILFAVLVILDWDRLQRRRALVGYFAGIASMLLANVLRITIMVALGNSVSAALVVRHHLSAGWIFFTSAFFLYLIVTYRWLLGMETRRLYPGVNET
jgi:exosortase/archaeosortase family protein